MSGVVRTARKLARLLRGDDARRVAELEQRVAGLKRKVENLRERRLVQQWGSPYTDGPRFRLDYDGADIEVVAAARQRTARAQTKEPFTVAWLQDVLEPGDVLYDIGASVGSYSLIAAFVEPHSTVVAIEPGFLNFGALCSNLAINDLGGRVIAVPLALSDAKGSTPLRYWSIAPGAGTHAAESRSGDGSVFELTGLTVTVDSLVADFGLPAPTLVKLDVDGLEEAVLAGARETLGRPELRSLLVELPAEGEPDPTSRLLTAAGFHPTVLHARGEGSGVRYARFDRPRT